MVVVVSGGGGEWLLVVVVSGGGGEWLLVVVAMFLLWLW